jgi:NAD(P)-dependent dehydrogenase (short-subunit alcohol dehydrogenase family)
MTAGLQDAFGLDGKLALVTGGGSGIGFAIARCLIAAGARVVIAGRRSETLDEAVASLGQSCLSMVVDLAYPDTLKAFESHVGDQFGAVDILVNNAGNTVKKPFDESSLDEFDSVFDVHVRGALELTRHVIRRQLVTRPGTVLFIASMTSFIGQPNVLPYTVSKTALTGAVRGLSAEYASRGIRVNAVAPGWIDTELFRRATESDPARKAKIMGRIQTGVLGDPDDIGWACCFLASRAGKYITGQTLVVDGGGAIGF